METQEQEKKFSKFYDKHYGKLLLIPIILILFSFAYMFVFYSNNGDFFHQDFSLTGGTSVTVIGDVNSIDLEEEISKELGDISTREIYDITTGRQTAVVVETTANIGDTRDSLENYLGYSLNEENSSFEFIDPALGENFYRQLLTSILFAFLLMSIIIFMIFRKFLPSLAVIISAFADIFMTLTLVNLLGIEISSGGLVAFLMIIGYSVDTDILLTNRLLKRTEGSLNERMFGAFKTGMTMTLTSILAVGLALFVSLSFSNLLSQIFTILFIGLCFDILNTWITNASMLKWYLEKNGN